MTITYQTVRDLLAKGELTKAIQYAVLLAKETQEKDYERDMTLFAARNNRNQKDYDRGVLERQSYQMETNRITAAIGSTLDSMEEDFPSVTAFVQTPSAQKKRPESSSPVVTNGNGNVVITRVSDSTIDVNTNPQKPVSKQKILFLAANPSNQASLQTDKEYRMIRAELERGKKRDLYEFLHPQLSLTVEELLRALDDKPDIIHFSGHGEKTGIVIVTDDNKPSIIPTEALEYLFESAKEYVKIVVLNACHSSTQAEVISKLGIYVVGNNLAIEDDAAVDFARVFYLSLGQGNSLEKAYKSAKFALMVKNATSAKIVEVWKDGVLLNL